MKFFLIFVAALAFPKTFPTYNGAIEYYIADLGPVYPCHPNFEPSSTWLHPDDP
jgi:hypothetical protein